MLGAGGAARAVVWALREAGAADVAVWNRTPERAAGWRRARRCARWSGRSRRTSLVNATSVGLPTDDDALGAAARRARAAAGWSSTWSTGRRDHHALHASGPSVAGRPAWLTAWRCCVRQGALSFERWTGREAPLDAMRAAAGNLKPHA